jgi:protein-S-isoprenylcysteine O-methyltransferase Ste14
VKGGHVVHMDRIAVRLVGGASVAALPLAATSMEQSVRLTVGIFVGLPSFILTILSRRQLGESFSVMPEARALVTTGLYVRIQHPMYVFLDLFLIALIVVFDWPAVLVLWMILVVVQVLQVRREETVLAAAFGPEYEAYQRQTWF